MNPLAFFKGASVQFQLAVLALALLAGFIGGWRVHAWKTDASLYQSINRIEKTRQNDTAQAGKIIDANEKTKEVIRYVYKTVYRQAEALPDADNICFSADSLSLWNESIAAANRHRQEPAAAPETDDAVAAGELVATVEQVIKNASDNFEACALNSADHNALIDRIESLNGKMCYCAE